jgi:hypothetical protein
VGSFIQSVIPLNPGIASLAEGLLLSLVLGDAGTGCEAE